MKKSTNGLWKIVGTLIANKSHCHSRHPEKILKVLSIYRKNILGEELSQAICCKYVFRLPHPPKFQIFSIKLIVCWSKLSGTYLNRKQLFYEKATLMNFTKFIGKNLCRSLYFNRFLHLQPKERLLQRRFSVSFATTTKIIRIIRITFLQNFPVWPIFCSLHRLDSQKRSLLRPLLFKYFWSKHCESLGNNSLWKS